MSSGPSSEQFLVNITPDVLGDRPGFAKFDELRSARIPETSLLAAAAESCHGCAPDLLCHNDACAQYPSGFEIDNATPLLGSLSLYSRHVVFATGVSDWAKEVTDDPESAPGRLYREYDGRTQVPDTIDASLWGSVADESLSSEDESLPSIAPLSGQRGENATRLSVTCGSNLTSEDAHDKDTNTILVFPDFTLVDHVPNDAPSMKSLVDSYLGLDIPRASLDARHPFPSYVLPYGAVILLCSHKKRDNRCSVAAKLLAQAFTSELIAAGVEVDTRGGDDARGEAIDSWPAHERKDRLVSALKGRLSDLASGSGSVGLFNMSHIGGHKFAGNVTIYFANGASLWYGRVQPRDVKYIVRQSILGGKVIPELLRGGIGISRRDSLLAW